MPFLRGWLHHVFEIHMSRRPNQLSDCLSQVSTWRAKWQMFFNGSKCVNMTATSRKQQLPFTYIIRDVCSETVTLTSNLSWNLHISDLVKKSTRTLWFLRRNLHNCTSATKSACYESLISPMQEYADVEWSPWLNTTISGLETVQIKALRSIYNRYDRRSSMTELYNQSGFPHLAIRKIPSRLKNSAQALRTAYVSKKEL